MSEHKHFRELIPPGTTFEFVGKRRLWIGLSLLVMVASFCMLMANRHWRGEYLNFNIDFRGGTEIIFSFPDREVKSGDVRAALSKAQVGDFDVSDLSWSVPGADGKDKTMHGLMVRTVDFAAVSKEDRDKSAAGFQAHFGGEEVVPKVSWSGDTLHVRSKKPITEAEASGFLASIGLEMKPLGDLAAVQAVPAEGTGEYNYQFPIYGIDRQYQVAIENGIGSGVKAKVEQVYAVGAKAGKELRNDGIKAMFYAMLLIMLYLAFRFDIRYAPGATVAMLHDAFAVIGVFAVTWTDFSLVSVAAILTVIGYSVNDTVIIFDRIRENMEKLKDKKFLRIVNISLNETLSRTLLTASTVFVTTLMMNIFGTGAVRNFAFAMNVGVIVGTYSSIFIASPIFIAIHHRWYAADESATPRRGRPAKKVEEEPVEDGGDEPEPDEGEGAQA